MPVDGRRSGSACPGRCLVAGCGGVSTGEPAVAVVDFFVSYASADEAWAIWVAGVLEAEGGTVAVQAWDSVAGVNVVNWVSQQIAAARRTVAICSRSEGSGRAVRAWRRGFSSSPPGDAPVGRSDEMTGRPVDGLLRAVTGTGDGSVLRSIASILGTAARIPLAGWHDPRMGQDRRPWRRVASRLIVDSWASDATASGAGRPVRGRD